jgi:hypothetical protein
MSKPNLAHVVLCGLFLLVCAAFWLGGNPDLAGLGDLDESELYALGPLPEADSLDNIGKLVNGEFQVEECHSVWQATSAADFRGVCPTIHLYAEMKRDLKEFPDGPPAMLRAKIRSFRQDGTPVSAGVVLDFRLVRTGTFHVYRSQRPFVLMENPELEGDHGELIAVAGDEGCYTEVIRLQD